MGEKETLMKRQMLSGICVGLLLAASMVCPTAAANNIHVVVKTIQASEEGKYLDPRLSPLIEELQSVFRYSSYRLLSEDGMKLSTNQTGRVRLPGGRVLRITPKATTDDRVELSLRISKGKKQIFQTVVQLLNQGSIIVGGPRHEAGTLLFRISASY